MTGALVLAFVIVVVLPVSILMGGAVISAILGWTMWQTAEDKHEGSELIDLNT